MTSTSLDVTAAVGTVQTDMTCSDFEIHVPRYGHVLRSIENLDCQQAARYVVIEDDLRSRFVAFGDGSIGDVDGERVGFRIEYDFHHTIPHAAVISTFAV